MSRWVKVTVERDDGHVSEFQGAAALCVVMDDIPFVDSSDPVEIMANLPDMPMVSMRADNAKQMALMMACLIAAVQAKGGGEAVMRLAIILSAFISASDPMIHEEHPRQGD